MTDCLISSDKTIDFCSHLERFASNEPYSGLSWWISNQKDQELGATVSRMLHVWSHFTALVEKSDDLTWARGMFIG